jgi:hypothetical protein
MHWNTILRPVTLTGVVTSITMQQQDYNKNDFREKTFELEVRSSNSTRNTFETDPETVTNDHRYSTSSSLQQFTFPCNFHVPDLSV